MLPVETRDYQNWELKPRTVYYLAPGVHHGSFSASEGDVFVGGFAGSVGSTLDGAYKRPVTAIDSNITTGEQPNVTIAYLTIQKFTPPVDQTAINQTGAGGWRHLNSTVTLNVPGGGMFAATDNMLRNNCLTRNGQYGFPSARDHPGGRADRRPLQRVGREQRDQLQRHLRPVRAAQQRSPRLEEPQPRTRSNSAIRECGVVKGDGNRAAASSGARMVS